MITAQTSLDSGVTSESIHNVMLTELIGSILKLKFEHDLDVKSLGIMISSTNMEYGVFMKVEKQHRLK